MKPHNWMRLPKRMNLKDKGEGWGLSQRDGDQGDEEPVREIGRDKPRNGISFKSSSENISERKKYSAESDEESNKKVLRIGWTSTVGLGEKTR